MTRLSKCRGWLLCKLGRHRTVRVIDKISFDDQGSSLDTILFHILREHTECLICGLSRNKRGD